MSDATHQSNPSFTVLPMDGRFQVRDQDGNVYGEYETRPDANAALIDWEKYYND